MRTPFRSRYSPAVSLADRLITRFGAHRGLWRLRVRIRNARFGVSRSVFGISYSVEQKSGTATALPYLLRNAVLPVLIALALVVAMDLLNAPMAEQAKDWGWPAISAGTYDLLFQAVAATTGVFLALYFTAVATVAANVYVNVPHDIRALLVRDRLGNLYVSGVAFTIALSVLLLIAHALTGRAYWLAPPAIGLLAAFSIFAFIRLGQRAFYLADPTLLANTLAYDFGSWLKRSKAGGHQWRDPSFQQHYHRQARASATSLASLVAIADDQPHLRSGSLRQLTTVVVALLSGYLGLRDKIPTSSRWFGGRYEHKQWYLTSGTELDTATATATALQPATVPDVTWVEDMLLPPLVGLLEADLKHQNYEAAYDLLGKLAAVHSRLGERWAAPYGAGQVACITSLATKHLPREDLPEPLRPALIPGVWDSVAMLPLSLDLGFHTYVTRCPISQLSQKLLSGDWSEPRAPYAIGAPREVVATLEKIQAGREFERAVDAPPATQTPNWYAREVALNSYEHAFQTQIIALVDLLTAWYPTVAQTLIGAKQPDAAGAVLSRGLEAAWKLEAHLDDWEAIAAALRDGPLLIELRRPQWDWSAIREKVSKMQTELLRQLADLIPLHAARERSADMPDYLGEAVHRVGEASFSALVANDAELFCHLFPTYFVGVLAVVDRIREQAADWDAQQAATAMAEPVADLMDISGFALILSELHGNPQLWEPCETRWSQYLQGGDGARRLAIVAALHNHQRHLFALTPRGTGRARWQMRVGELLTALPRGPSSSPFDPGQVEHPSALIRRIAPRGDLLGGLTHDASDLFVVRFVRTLVGADQLDFGVADWVIEALTEGEDEDDEEDKP